jgi:hypothetical protein
MPSVVKSKLFVGFAAVLLAMVVGFGFAQMRGHAQHAHGAGHQHDMVNMPGLKGRDATAEESEELAVMFNRFEEISRSVENLPNGIRTVTFA